jgi:hypothetical protein
VDDHRANLLTTLAARRVRKLFEIILREGNLLDEVEVEPDGQLEV